MDIVRKIILDKDLTFVLANFEAGAQGTAIVVQDNVGGHNLALPNNLKYRGFININKDPNSISIIKWVVDDSGVYVYTEGSGFNIVPVKGNDGVSYYTWIRYADTPTSGMSALPTGKKYLGVAYNKTSPTPSTNYNDYGWSLVKGNDGVDGSDGIDGRNGIDGLDGDVGSPNGGNFFHVAYANSSDGSLNFNQAAGNFIGTYVDTTPEDSLDYTKYQWQQLRGSDGKDGTNGIGGVNGADGKTSYLHIKYSNNGGINFTLNQGEDVGDYIGQYVDYTEADSTNPALYKWAKIKGVQGDKGDIGNEGIQGKQGAYLSGGEAWSSTKQYIQYPERIVVVKYNDLFYATKVGNNVNIPIGTLPTNVSFWSTMNSYANVATDILLANDAYLARLESKNIYIGDGVSGWVMSAGSIKSIQKNANGTARTSLTSDGRLFASDVDLTGNINATSGNIGGISITNNGISSTNFSIDKNGIASFTNANITGVINATSGSIGGFSFNNSTTGLNGEKIVVDGNVGAIVKNGGVFDGRGGNIFLPLINPTNLQNGAIWLDGTGVSGTPNAGGASESPLNFTAPLVRSGNNVSITGYNNSNWDAAYNWGSHTGRYVPLTGGKVTGNLGVQLIYGGTAEPTVHLAIGDYDTGFHSYGDGNIHYVRNGVDSYSLANVWHSDNLNPASYIKVSPIMLGTGSVDGALTSGIYRNENANGGNLSYAPLLSLSGADTGLQITGGYATDKLMFRGWHSAGPLFTPWRTIWHDGNLSQTAIDSWNAAYNQSHDKTKLWATSHPNEYYLQNTWDGTFWWINSNHPSPAKIAWSSNSDVSTRAVSLSGVMSENDAYRIIGYNISGTNSGALEIATADDGTEPIYVRQYVGDFQTVQRTLTLLDAGGDTTIPGSLNGASIQVASEGAGSDPYGKISVTRGTASNFPYYGLTRAGQVGWSIGIDTSNNLIFGTGGSTGVMSTSAYITTGGVVAASRFVSGFDSGQNNSMSCSNWFRSNGSSGWYNETYGGGIYMSDGAWLRTHGNKGFYCDKEVQSPIINATAKMTIPTAAPASVSNGDIWIS